VLPARQRPLESPLRGRQRAAEPAALGGQGRQRWASPLRAASNLAGWEAAGGAASAAEAAAVEPHHLPAGLDLSAILGSRPASPDAFPPSPDALPADTGGNEGGGSGSEGAPWLAAHSVWHAASPEASPVRAAGSAARADNGRRNSRGGGEGRDLAQGLPAAVGDGSDAAAEVAADEVPVSSPQAVRSLQRLQTHAGIGPRPTSPLATQQALQRHDSPGHRSSSSPAAERHSSPIQQRHQQHGLDGGRGYAVALPPRPSSPLLPGLGVSRRQAQQLQVGSFQSAALPLPKLSSAQRRMPLSSAQELPICCPLRRPPRPEFGLRSSKPACALLTRSVAPLQAAVGRLAGNPSADDAAALQAALTHALEQETAHVQVGARACGYGWVGASRRWEGGEGEWAPMPGCVRPFG
jgi:hypothetical protein